MLFTVAEDVRYFLHKATLNLAIVNEGASIEKRTAKVSVVVVVDVEDIRLYKDVTNRLMSKLTVDVRLTNLEGIRIPRE